MREWERLTVVNLLDVLDVPVHREATNILKGHAELKGAVRCPIYGNVEAIVTGQDVDLEVVP